MSRRVRALPPRALGATAQPVEIDTYFDKVLKYIPADIVGAWVAVTGLVSSARDIPRQTVLWVAFGIGLILTAWWTWRQATVPGRRPPVTQTVISSGAFAVWVFALGGPFQYVPGREVYGSLLLILYTLVAALINPKEG
jgi:Na+/phosphate symporter